MSAHDAGRGIAFCLNPEDVGANIDKNNLQTVLFKEHCSHFQAVLL